MENERTGRRSMEDMHRKTTPCPNLGIAGGAIEGIVQRHVMSTNNYNSNNKTLYRYVC
jgi:hypothetical protein